MMVKLIIISLIFASIGFLFASVLGFFQGKEVLAKRLTWRMITSVLAFLLLCLAGVMGWIQPHPLGG